MANIQAKDLVDVAGHVQAAVEKAAADPKVPLTEKESDKVAKSITPAIQAGVKKDLQPVIDVIANQEPFYFSVQWWTQMAGYIIVLMGILGYTVPEEMKVQIMSLISVLVGAAVAFAMFYNRYIRSSALLRKLKGDPGASTGS